MSCKFDESTQKQKREKHETLKASLNYVRKGWLVAQTDKPLLAAVSAYVEYVGNEMIFSRISFQVYDAPEEMRWKMRKKHITHHPPSQKKHFAYFCAISRAGNKSATRRQEFLIVNDLFLCLDLSFRLFFNFLRLFRL